MLKLHAIGDWQAQQVVVRTVAGTRKIVPEVEKLIDHAWDQVKRRPDVKLFDGPMCRMEQLQASPRNLEIGLSQTSYKPFMGTNLAHPELADKFGTEVMANPVGVSSAVESADGYLLLGKRNASVAYYPNRTHPFAGALEPRDGGDAFGAVARELNEELALQPDDFELIRCTGVVEDLRLRHMEMLFRVRTRLSRSQIESQVHREEHGDSVAVKAEGDPIIAFLQDPDLTPVAVGSLLLWGRIALGTPWFESCSRHLRRLGRLV
jgi:8-oxo-dGTP pyrophosphatase MutT (NUDIX family)